MPAVLDPAHKYLRTQCGLPPLGLAAARERDREERPATLPDAASPSGGTFETIECVPVSSAAQSPRERM